MSLLHITRPNSKYIDKQEYVYLRSSHRRCSQTARTSALLFQHSPTYPPAPSPKPIRDVLQNLYLYSHHPRKLDQHLHLVGLQVGLQKGAQVWDQLRSLHPKDIRMWKKARSEPGVQANDEKRWRSRKKWDPPGMFDRSSLLPDQLPKRPNFLNDQMPHSIC
jgi:hypothetical protein